jgi:uncharacterized protein YndB with AHSA1/START domain
MPVTTWTVTVNRTPQEVFAYLTDMEHHGEWSPKPYSITPLGEGPLAVGSRYRSTGWIPRDPNHVNEVEITAIEPPRRFSFNSIEAGAVSKHDFLLTAQDGGTKVDRVIDMPKPKGAPGLAFPVLFATFIKPAIQKDLESFKVRCEQAARPAEGGADTAPAGPST